MRAYSKKDVDKKALKGARIAVLGYGSQGRAHALNLRDSGYDVVVGNRRGGQGWKKAKKDGFAVAEPAKAADGATLVALLAPDLAQPGVYNEIEKTLPRGAAILFAHGFNIHFGMITPPDGPGRGADRTEVPGPPRA
jgi:ketol-acid reductoisomerase